MALAEYFDRAALAAAQIIAGFDEEAFREQLGATTVGLCVAPDAGTTPEGQALAELAVRLLARLYPSLSFHGDAELVSTLRGLAQEINPRIDAADAASVGVVIGQAESPFARTVYAGSDQWTAMVSSENAQPVGDSRIPFGAGAAACFACANIFRLLFLDNPPLDTNAVFSTYAGDESDAQGPPILGSRFDATLVGLGAVGNAVVWALERAGLTGTLQLVDNQDIELSNLQRYVLAKRADEGRPKTDHIASALEGTDLKPQCETASWSDFATGRSAIWQTIVALDSARDRRAVQASLPMSVTNAWTQPDDLGVSSHSRFGGDGACLACLYLPSGPAPNEDEIVAQALGVPERQQQVRLLLADGGPLPHDLLDAVAAALGISVDLTVAWQSRSIRELYAEGLCGGALVPLGQLGRPREDVHVPVAHQSALAGVLLAAAAIRTAIEGEPPVTRVSRINLMRSLGIALSQPAASDPAGRCICRDADFVGAYNERYR